MLKFSEPRIIERGLYNVVGAYATFEGNDEGPGWSAADKAFFSRQSEIVNNTDSLVLGFLYRPHKDHPEISAEVRACFIGAEVADLDHVPPGMSVTHFSGGSYVIVDCIGDTMDEAANGVGDAINFLTQWMPEHGYREGDACFSAGDMKAVRPPHVEMVHIKLEPAATAG